jgi:hypothetical protein
LFPVTLNYAEKKKLLKKVLNKKKCTIAAEMGQGINLIILLKSTKTMQFEKKAQKM